MASNGYISNQFRTGYKVQIYWTLNSQNIANNTSNITVNAQLVSTGSSYTINASATKYGSLTINGTTYNFTFNASLSGNQTKTVYSKTIDIPHNGDGTKSVSMATTLGINVSLSGTYWGDVSTSGSGEMNTIPRTSSISLSTYNATIGSTKIGVNINRASDSFTHKVYYRFGSINWLVSDNASTYAEFTPALSDCAQIPNSTSGNATIYVETWSGGTFIGSTTSGLILNVPDNIVPSFSSITASLVPAGADASYGYIQGKSKCRLVINGATGNQGSTIKSYGIWGGGFSSYTSDYTTPTISHSGSITFTGYVVDSRGRQSADKTITINVQEYTIPNITSWAVIRCLADGTANDDGTYIKISPNYTYTTLGGKNSVTSNAQYKGTDTSVWVNVGAIATGTSKVTGGGNISTSKSFDVSFTVSDNFSSVSRSLIIPTAFATMDFKKGGKGIAIGKAAEHDNLFDIAMDTRHRNYVSLDQGFGVHRADANGGTTGYLLVAQIKINSQYQDQPIRISYTQRGLSYICTLELLFYGTNDLDPNVRTFTKNGTDTWGYVYKVATGTWNLYIWKNGGWDTIDIVDVEKGRYLSNTTITWKNEFVANPPSGNIEASMFQNRSGVFNSPLDVKGGESRFSKDGTWADCLEGYGGAIKCNGDIVANSMRTPSWFRSHGRSGWYNETYGGGIFMQNDQFVEVYNGKKFYCSNRIETPNAVQCRYIDASPGQNLDLSTNGDGSFFINVHSPANANAFINKRWAGSEGGELSFYNSRGNAYGFLGNTGATWFRVYGYGGTVSYRPSKYDISKADIEQQYENVKSLNIYNYRSISDERDEDGNVVSMHKRQDLYLGCMVDELPLETTFYDNEGGDGKAVDMYSYTTMILGATQELIKKVEVLENKVDSLETDKATLIDRLEKLEAIVNGIVNNG